MSIFLLATLGGLISALSTSVGSLLAPLFSRIEKLRRYHLSMDFALGVMLSAVAFSLVGPVILREKETLLAFSGLVTGGLFILTIHKMINHYSRKEKIHSNKLLLIGALLFHNLPEGMGAGASLGSMTLNEAIPLQIALSLQNIIEGLLLTLLLQSLGVGLIRSVIGGVFSGLIEMSGAVIAGFFIQTTINLLPFFLALAGGAMMISVLLELKENLSLGKRFQKIPFTTGLIIIPLTNYLLA